LPITDEIRHYEARLTREPSSQAFAALAEAYRRAGRADEARRSVAALSRRLGEVEADFRARLSALAAEEESERVALEARLGEIARRIEQTVSRAEERLGAFHGSTR